MRHAVTEVAAARQPGHMPFIVTTHNIVTVTGVTHQGGHPVDISSCSPLVGRPRTFVLVDPTSDDGETSLDALDTSDDHVSLVVLLRGRSSSALREFAAAEGIDHASAGWIYLDQVAERIASADRIVETIVATGPDPAFELADLGALNDTRRVILPSSLPRIDARAFRRLVDQVPCVVVVGGDHAPAAC